MRSMIATTHDKSYAIHITCVVSRTDFFSKWQHALALKSGGLLRELTRDLSRPKRESCHCSKQPHRNSKIKAPILGDEQAAATCQTNQDAHFWRRPRFAFATSCQRALLLRYLLAGTVWLELPTLLAPQGFRTRHRALLVPEWMLGRTAQMYGTPSWAR